MSVNAELENILALARHPGAGAKQQAIAKINYSHEAMIDLIITNPGISQNALAERFGYTPAWISQVIASDTFQNALAKRREEIVDPLMRSTVEDNFKALVARSLDILQQKLNRPALDIPDNLALRTLEIASRAAGYGVKDSQPASSTTSIDLNIHLEQLGGGLVALLQRKRLEANVVDVQSLRGANTGEAAPMLDSSSAQAASLIGQLVNDDSQEP